MSRFSQIPWRFSRRATQVVCLLLFLWVFRKTEYTGVTEIPGAANILFRIDPLVAASVMVAAKRVVLTVLWSPILVALTVVLGRFFCGWVCPLGTLLDGVRRFVAGCQAVVGALFKRDPPSPKLRRTGRSPRQACRGSTA